jgi:formate dehydrogenase iron-sulfur subunit
MPEPMGFYTDTTVCIGCKACEVACKEWNQLPAINGGQNTLSGDSYDNTRRLDGINWRHVKFIEQFGPTSAPPGPAVAPPAPQGRWLMMSDVCKHCVQAGCLEVCPTGAIIRTEFDTVVIQADVCNGCRDCVGACPFGVIHMGGGENAGKGIAKKCTLCYDRLQHDQTPACAQTCPTTSIRFGDHEDMVDAARTRVSQLHDQGFTEARLYGANEDDGVGGTGSIFLLLDEPEVYGLPPDPVCATSRLPEMFRTAGYAGLGMLGAAAVAFLGGRA